MKYLPLCLFMCLFLFGCQKEQDRRALGAYYKYTINGVETKIEDGAGVYENTFSCELFGDTALYVNVSKSFEQAGFYIHATRINDTTYTFDNFNRAYYTEGSTGRRFKTDDTHTGQVTLKRGTFQASSMLNIMQGDFTYQAIDSFTGKTVNLMNGSFMMEITER